MSKRVSIDMNLTEIKLVLDSLDSLRHESVFTRLENNAIIRLSEVLEEQRENLEQDELHSKMYTEDEDGYESLTDYGREALAEKYGAKD